MLKPAFQFHPIFEAPFFNPIYTEAVRHEREISHAGGKNWNFAERDKCKPGLLSRVSDPYSFDTYPDPAF
jgi:hypothetical protein